MTLGKQTSDHGEPPSRRCTKQLHLPRFLLPLLISATRILYLLSNPDQKLQSAYLASYHDKEPERRVTVGHPAGWRIFRLAMKEVSFADNELYRPALRTAQGGDLMR